VLANGRWDLIRRLKGLNSRVEDLNIATWQYVILAACRLSKSRFCSEVFKSDARRVLSFDRKKYLMANNVCVLFIVEYMHFRTIINSFITFYKFSVFVL
jgi:hypothetical protein